MIFYNNSFDHIVLYWFFCKFYIFNESHWILSSVIFLSKKWRGNMYFATLCAYSEISFDFKLSGTGIFSVWHIHFLVCRFRLNNQIRTYCRSDSIISSGRRGSVWNLKHELRFPFFACWSRNMRNRSPIYAMCREMRSVHVVILFF